MRFPLLICGCLILAVAGCVSKTPGTQQRAVVHRLDGPGPYSYDCDAEVGYFATAQAPILGDHLRVTGTLHVTSKVADSTWNSAASVGFENSSQKSMVGFQMVVMPNPSDDKINFVIRADAGPQNVTSVAFQPDKGSDMPFTLEIDNGMVSVATAGAVSTSKLTRVDLNRLTLGCSGAHVSYSNVAIIALH